MLNRIIRIMGTALTGALLLAGCSVWLDDPARTTDFASDEAIGFSAGSSLLLDDEEPTKTEARLYWAILSIHRLCLSVGVREPTP